MNDTDWASARDALDRAERAGRTVTVWLRDDDCVAMTPALDRLTGLCEAAALPILLAVIPEPADPELAGWTAAHPGVAPCQHGFAHRNHAPAGERARELGGARDHAAIFDELARGRAKLQALFGTRLADILVPPWNRIEAALVPGLASLGYTALSTFGAEGSDGLPHLNCDLDIIDWRSGRVGRTAADLSRRLAVLLDTRDTIGILTHHLAHDEAAWAGLTAMLDLLGAHPGVRFTDAGTLLEGGRGLTPP